jgi:glutaredoxin
MDVFVFTLNHCVHCNDLKTKLNNSKILFKELDIYEHELFWKEIVKKTGDNVVPTICLYDNDKNIHVFTPGKDFNNGDEAISILKNYIL